MYSGYQGYPRKIYAIQHNKTGRIYVGSAKDVEARYRVHISNLHHHNHFNKAMQEDFDKYGEDYTLYILDDIADKSENSKEYDWIEKLHADDPENGYNKRMIREKQIPWSDGLPMPNYLSDGD